MAQEVARPTELTARDLVGRNLGGINVILGKNGCGKSTFLHGLDAVLGSMPQVRTRYITPERGGMLDYQPNVESNISGNPSWLRDTRRANRFGQFREQTVVQYRLLELAVLRKLEDDVRAGGPQLEAKSFHETVDQINELLDNVQIRRASEGGGAFTTHSRATGEQVGSSLVSSGETELISLAIECLTFAAQCEPDKENVLLLDEPDVHLHPDLQARLMQLLIRLVNDNGFTVLLATHSTAVVAALASTPETRVALMKAGDRELQFHAISEVHRRVLPIFGAHPLSNIFNKSPVLLVEGDDDERIWQQAVKTSQGKLRLYPVACDGVSHLPEYEGVVTSVLGAVYDNPVGFSLRDRDNDPESIEDLPPLVRCRLSCRTAENLLLSDDVLGAAGVAWTDVVERIQGWLGTGLAHPKRAQMQDFADGGFERKSAPLKDIRMLLVGEMIGSSKPWEVLVGQTIGTAYVSGHFSVAAHSLGDYLGTKTVSALLT
jgi:energy-coupling factor transporter ATP-binding protein EcfA2